MYIYKKHPQFDSQRDVLLTDLKQFLKCEVSRCDIYHLYQFDKAVNTTSFLNLNEGELVATLPPNAFCVAENKGQYNQVQDLTQKYLNQFLNIPVSLNYKVAYDIECDEADLIKIKNYIINPVVAKEVDVNDIDFSYANSDNAPHEFVHGFMQMDQTNLRNVKQALGMELDDLTVIQNYFKKEGRNPRWCELKMLDAYWSDHCRHTTFLTHLTDIQVQAGQYQSLIQQALDDYLKDKADKPATLMSLATINSKLCKAKGLLNNVEESEEVNACSVEVDVEIGDQTERWLHLFKNETHNHPTEIEPYGGAHTCIGGCIRDPLSGRAKVFSGIRIIGAGNPLTAYEDTLLNKLPQHFIAQTAKNGFSDYANQIGSPVGLVKEFYHEGFVAKRMELGALVAAVKKDDIKREKPVANDVILLLGAPTGRDGLGAAVGSSSMQTAQSLSTASAQVQKGNPFEEKNILRLFNRPEATKLIKRCNDFGAGGVSVAIGELAAGLDIYLDNVPTKYPGMNGYEIALSESQERMAVVIALQDLEQFQKYCEQEDVLYAQVAVVNDEKRVRMHFKGEIIIDLKRDLLDSNGATKSMTVEINSNWLGNNNSDACIQLSRQISPNLSSQFDSLNGKNRVFLEYGGKTGQTQQRADVSKFPHPQSKTVSIMSYGYYPNIGQQAPFHAGYYATLQAITSNAMISGNLDQIRLTMQEYFPAIKNNPEKMGNVVASLLGSYQVMKALNLAAIGGKDSMSGTYQTLEVPNSLVCFAVNTGHIKHVVSRELKQAGNKVYLSKLRLNEHKTVDLTLYQKMLQSYFELYQKGEIVSVSDINEAGLQDTLLEMGLGNELKVASDLETGFVPGALVFEVKADCAVDDTLFEYLGEVVLSQHDSTSKTALMNKVYGTLEKHSNKLLPYCENQLPSLTLTSKVCQLVLTGSIGEDDLKQTLSDQGFDVCQLIFKHRDHEQFQASLQSLVRCIDESSLFVIGHGDYLASVIQSVSYPISVILENALVKAALTRLIQRKGLVLGFGAGFNALLESGYFGDLQQDLQLVTNPYHRYVCDLCEIQVVGQSILTPTAKLYHAPISTRSSVYVCQDLHQLKEKVNIITMKKAVHFTQDSGIDGLASKNGQVLGFSSLPYLMDETLYQNGVQIKMPTIFTSLKELIK